MSRAGTSTFDQNPVNIAIGGHILPFYNKGVCQRRNVDDKIELFLLFLKKLVQDGDSELRMQNTGDRIQEKNKAKGKKK